MNLKTIFFIILGIIFGILLGYSAVNGNFLEIILSIILVVIITYLFFKFHNYSKILYITIVILLLMLLTIIIMSITRNYGLENIIPSLGGLMFALFYIENWEKNVLITKSTVLIKEYKMEEALPYFDKLLKKDSENFYALHNKASALAMMEKYDDALELTNKILEKKPNNMLGLNLKAYIFTKLKRYNEALEINEEILKKESKNEFALSGKALILSRQWKYEESLKYYEEAVKRISSKGKLRYMGMPVRTILPPKQIAEIWFEKGKVHQRLGQHREALECFDKGLELDPEYGEIERYKEVLNLMGNFN